MKPSRCQPLQQRWQAVAQAHAAAAAVYLVAEGRVLTFADLRQLAEASPPAGAWVKAEGRGVDFLLAVLRAWRDDAVLLPWEGGTLVEPDTLGLPSTICHIKTTSGSTGQPRQVLFTAEQLIADADQIVRTMGLRQEWPNVAAISMAHSYGFSNLVLPLLLHGIPLVVAESPLPHAMRAALDGGPAFTVAAVPAMWRAWQAAGVVDARIRLAISAGAPLPLDLERAVFASSGVKIHNFYGSSECGGIAYDRTAAPRTDGALIGTPVEEVRLTVNAANGCLMVLSPAAGYGYQRADDALAEGRFQTADVVRLEGGAVWLEGRTGEAINVAGRKISPSVIEEKLSGIPGVRHCVVFGIPSADRARVDEIVACLNLSGNGDIAAIRQASARLLSAIEQPRHWRLCPDLEPDVRGKISRIAWRERWLSGAGFTLAGADEEGGPGR